MPFYMKRPVVVEARQWTGENLEEMFTWTHDRFRVTASHGAEFTAEVFDFLHDQWIPLRTGDFVIKGTKGEFHPCEQELFWEYYIEQAVP